MNAGNPMANDMYKRDLLFRLRANYKYPDESDLLKLFTNCYLGNQAILAEPEIELGVLPFSFIKTNFNFTTEYINELLQPIQYSGGGLVASVKSNISTALFIYQKYRLLTVVDKMVSKRMRSFYINNNEPYEDILKTLKLYSTTRRRKLSESELEFQYWHFVENYSMPDTQMNYIRQQTFEKCFKDVQKIFKTTDGTVETLKIIIDKYYENI